MLEDHGVSTKHGGKWSAGKVQRILTGRWVKAHLLNTDEDAESVRPGDAEMPLAA